MSQTTPNIPNMTKNADELHWFIAYVKTCCEHKAGELFVKLGYETYLPCRREVHQWSDRKKIVERLVLPHMIFVHTTEAGRVESLKLNPYLNSYMSKGMGPYAPAIVRDEEMRTFRAMVDYGGESFAITTEKLAPGDRVRVVAGPLEGHECELVSVNGRKCIASRLGILGAAVVEISTEYLRKIQ